MAINHAREETAIRLAANRELRTVDIARDERPPRAQRGQHALWRTVVAGVDPRGGPPEMPPVAHIRVYLFQVVGVATPERDDAPPGVQLLFPEAQRHVVLTCPIAVPDFDCVITDRRRVLPRWPERLGVVDRD